MFNSSYADVICLLTERSESTAHWPYKISNYVVNVYVQVQDGGELHSIGCLKVIGVMDLVISKWMIGGLNVGGTVFC